MESEVVDEATPNASSASEMASDSRPTASSARRSSESSSLPLLFTSHWSNTARRFSPTGGVGGDGGPGGPD
eukprot:scaffold3970_cov57-Phaeocystis_antarctica.AAC.2